MQCVILAGGLGTRMASVVPSLPKALIPVDGLPFAHHQLTLLASTGIRRVLYCVGHRGDAIRRFVGKGDAWGLEVRYVDEEDKLRGTAGALRLAADAGALEPAFLVLYGDSYLPIDFSAVGEAFQRSAKPGLLTVYRNDGKWEASNALVHAGQVIVYDKRRLHARAQEMIHIDYGLSALRQSTVEAYVSAGETADLADVYHQMSLKGELAAFEVRDRFYEIGSPAGAVDLERYLRSRRARVDGP